MSEIIFWSATAWSEQINGSIYSIPKNYMWREASFDWFLIPVLMRAWKTLTTSPPSLSLSFLLLSFSHIFTSPYLNPFPHLLHKPLFLLAVSVHAPPPLHTKFPECLLQFSRRLLDRTAELQSSAGGTTSLTLTATIHILYLHTSVGAEIWTQWHYHTETRNCTLRHFNTLLICLRSKTFCALNIVKKCPV